VEATEPWLKQVPFAKSNVGQFYFELCLTFGKLPRELAFIFETDPETYVFLEEAFAARLERLQPRRRKSHSSDIVELAKQMKGAGKT